MDKDIQLYTDIAAAYAIEAGMKILAAIAFWIIGSFVAVTLNIVLVVAILGYFGVQTTTFAALVAGTVRGIGLFATGLDTRAA